MGDTVEDCMKIFDRIFSIELDQILFENAVKKFKSIPHITIVQGDSGKIIKEILDDVNQPCLFWLDGHYSEGFTAKKRFEHPYYK